MDEFLNGKGEGVRLDKQTFCRRWEKLTIVIKVAAH